MASVPPNGAALRWHRALGIAAAVFVLFLSTTGMLLNHGTRLGLDRRTADSAWLLDWYGLANKTEIVSFQADGHWLTWSDRHLFLDGRAVAEHAAPLRGVGLSDGLLAAATPDEVFLLTRSGDLVERLNGAGLPGSIARAGPGPNGGFVIDTERGAFQARKNFAGWAETDPIARWSAPTRTPDDIRKKILIDYRGEGLPWSRVLLDVHSGRIFGAWGPMVMDAVAIALVLLAITGLVNWVRRRQ